MKNKYLVAKTSISINKFAKFASQELLLEELVFMKEGNKLYFLERYEDNPFRFKVKVFLTKLFLALVFGVIPVLPFSTYLEIVNLLLNTDVSIENLFFMGGMLFSIYFLLQNLNFFIMGMLDATMVISGRIFDWYECLPIPRKKLMKIAYLTLFRSYDLPIIVSFLAFPITMLIGSGNWVLFVISLIVSFVNVVISFSILILLGERINRTLDVNDSSSKKTMILRLINVLSYVFILFGSYGLIQWYTNSIDIINDFFITSGYRPSINLILCFIPFPFNLSYMISIFIAPLQASFQLWTSVLIGFSLVCITAYLSFTRSYRAIERATLSEVTQKGRKKKRGTSNLTIQVNIKSRTPFKAYLSRDLAVITRNPKAIITIILPMIVSFIYVITVGLEIVTVINFTNREFFLNWILLSILYPFLSGLIVFGLTHLESSGESITAGLPIVPRDQAKPKLTLMLTVLTCAILLPSLIYVNNPYFIVIFMNFITTLPLAWLTLIEIFLLKIRLFGKKRTKMYVLEDYSPKYRIYKWAIIIAVPYAIFTSLVLIYLSLFAFRDLLSMTTLFWLIPLVGITYLYLLFNRLLPNYKKTKSKK
jgi:predicted permease